MFEGYVSELDRGFTDVHFGFGFDAVFGAFVRFFLTVLLVDASM
jgi:hypothetical protein